jgi:sugar/nucleoside kinase (ribokinase family)
MTSKNENGLNVIPETSKRQNLKIAAMTVCCVDTTGCGDSYQAAFTVSWRREHNISEAMQKGASAAAETLKHMGGV